MVELGNINADVNHKISFPSVGYCDDPQTFILIDLIEIRAAEGTKSSWHIQLINDSDKAVAIHSFK